MCYEGWPLVHLFSIFRLASFFFSVSGSPFFFLWGMFLGLGYGDLLAVFGDDGFLFCCNSKPITRKIWTYREAFSRKATRGWEAIKILELTIKLILFFCFQNALGALSQTALIFLSTNGRSLLAQLYLCTSDCCLRKYTISYN